MFLVFREEVEYFNLDLSKLVKSVFQAALIPDEKLFKGQLAFLKSRCFKELFDLIIGEFRR